MVIRQTSSQTVFSPDTYRFLTAKLPPPLVAFGFSTNPKCLTVALLRQKSAPPRSPKASQSPGCMAAWSVASLPSTGGWVRVTCLPLGAWTWEK